MELRLKIKTESESSPSSTPRYYLEQLGKGLEVLDIMRRNGNDLRLTDVSEAVHFDKSSAFRNPGTKEYRIFLGYRNFRIGFAQFSSNDPFSLSVTQGFIDEAKRWRVELIMADNRMNAERAVSNPEWLIKQKVNFTIECQVQYRVAPMLADMFKKADIPTMAIDIPQSGAIYFGADNYTAGLIGGEALGHLARER
jgi:ribose transport system substrate-binding protein